MLPCGAALSALRSLSHSASGNAANSIRSPFRHSAQCIPMYSWCVYVYVCVCVRVLVCIIRHTSPDKIPSLCEQVRCELTDQQTNRESV